MLKLNRICIVKLQLLINIKADKPHQTYQKKSINLSFAEKTNSMKNTSQILSLLILFFSLISWTGEKERNDWEKNELKGKVKSYTEFHYELDSSAKTDQDFLPKIKKSFNVQGYIIEDLNYNEEGILDSETRYTYNENNRPAEALHYDGEGHLESIFTSEYDAQGRLIQVQIRTMDGDSGWTQKYDSDGNLIEKIEYYDNPNYNSSFVYTYDSKGNQIQGEKFDAKGKLLSKYQYNYNKKGKLTEEVWFDTDGKVLSKLAYKYRKKGRVQETKNLLPDLNSPIEWIAEFDKSGKLIREKTIYANPKLNTSSTYKFDRNDNPIEDSFYVENGKLDLRYTHFYDEKGMLTGGTIESSEGISENTFSYSYHYDEKENWTEQKQYENGKTRLIIKRDYTYFD